jgi:D-lyxose ketol-isomerase
MKRSEINSVIKETEAFFKKSNFRLPPFASYDLKKWKKARGQCAEIFDLGLGWDITDFGSGDFLKKGLTLFTVRNGMLKSAKYPKPYAEKIMLVRKGQITPMHFHAHKMEDIINRDGGLLVIQFYMADKNNKLSRKSLEISTDGTVRKLKAGDKIKLAPGESVTIPQRVYHTFTAERATVMAGEVSMVNDDSSDNYFLEKAGRFPEIKEDKPPYRLLVKDYAKILGLS